MDIKIIKEIVNQLSPISFIINNEEDILWISDNLKSILDIKSIEGLKLINLIGQDVNTNNKISINNKSYTISQIDIKENNVIILIMNVIDDITDPETKVFAYEEIINNLNDGVLVTDKEGKIILYNKAMEELEKKDADKMLGKKIWNAYDYNDKNKSEHMRVYESGNPVIDRYKAHAYNNGKPIYKSYSTVAIEKNKERIGVYTISKDETKLRTLLSEISELKRQFNSIETSDNQIKPNGTKYTFSDIVGTSNSTKKVIKEAQAIAWLDNSILLVGDTGTGKEVFAQSIHNFGKRRSEPFIGINCSAIPENLLESILFGSVKGSYTGSLDSPGLFEEAGKGTLFLDELNLMPINMQTKLLRVLQERNVRRVGGKENYSINCRIITAMNEDPYRLIKEDKLRQDLFYRISGYNIYIPKLIDREEDIFDISEYYISKYNLLMNKNILSISPELKKLMRQHNWPGNVRELSHFIENIMVRTEDNERRLKIENIPDYIIDAMDISKKPNLNIIEKENPLQDRLDSIEKEMIIDELHNQMWNVSRTAKVLGLTRQSLIYRMRKLDIKREDWIKSD